MARDGAQAAVERLVAEVLARPKYRDVAPEVVQRIATRQLAHGRAYKEALKATKSELHQVGGVYRLGGEHYDRWLGDLRDAQRLGTTTRLREVCAEGMRHHVSTRERLPILDRFFTQTLASIAPVQSVLDLACGLNPLAIPWMPLAPGATYYACDIYSDVISFLSDYLAVTGQTGSAWLCDLAAHCPPQHADVALLLKTLPCLFQMEATATLRLLRAIRARHLLVSFPVHSLGGRQRGMPATYEARFLEIVAETGWAVQRFGFSTELAFLVTTSADEVPEPPTGGRFLA